ncbi:hypothetical protein QBC35DRAFT_450993 [Podospora australis]|uniref:CYTH domain-containing protein n=1 Tax=Podospora australis TaxID=1536484 RepID=A0AAN7AHC2_9PEZI|nr:hypothetical protein QBC35DRAFT_450993 [Podospora australis]
MASTTTTMTPDFEVKFLLDSSLVLDSQLSKPTEAVRTLLGLPEKTTKMGVQFLDTPSRELYNAGWSPRIRKIEGEAGFELTYKKRYPIVNSEGGVIGGGGLAQALSLAFRDGFDNTDTKYEAQVEWGYAKQTLSISRKKKVKKDDKKNKESVELPDEKDSQKYLTEEAPGKFDDWSFEGWGKSLLKEAVVYGPVLAKRWEGASKGIEVDFEVWPVRTADRLGLENITEVSFKSDGSIDAEAKREQVRQLLAEAGLLLPRDSLKTELIMTRYGPVQEEEGQGGEACEDDEEE